MFKKRRVSNHAKDRYKQRYDGEIPCDIMARRAQNYGLKPHQLSYGEFRKFITDKESNSNKMVRILENYIFIYTSKGRVLITMYKIPNEFLLEYEKERWKEKKNYERFKKAKDKRKKRKTNESIRHNGGTT